MALYRLASANLYTRTINNIQRQQFELASHMEHVSAGKRVLRGSDDPVGAAQAERSMNRMARIEADKALLVQQESTIRYGESTLGEVYNAVQEFRTKLVQVGDGAYNQVQRDTLIDQLVHLRQQIEGYVNRKDANDLPLFRGLDTHALSAFPNAAEGVQSGQMNIGEYAITNALDGVRAFFSGKQGNGVLVTDVRSPAKIDPVTRELVITGGAITPDTAADDGERRGWIEAGTIKDPDQAAALSAGQEVTVTLKKDADGTMKYWVTGEREVDGSVKPPYAYMVGGRELVYQSGQTIRVQGMDFAIHSTNVRDGESFSIKKAEHISVFEVMDQAIAQVRAADRKQAPDGSDSAQALNDAGATNHGKLATDMARAISELDIAMSRISTVRGTAGSMLELVDKIENTLTLRHEHETKVRVAAEGYTEDQMVEAYSSLMARQTAVSAALQSYSSIQKLSLFDFIR